MASCICSGVRSAQRDSSPKSASKYFMKCLLRRAAPFAAFTLTTNGRRLDRQAGDRPLGEVARGGLTSSAAGCARPRPSRDAPPRARRRRDPLPPPRLARARRPRPRALRRCALRLARLVGAHPLPTERRPLLGERPLPRRGAAAGPARRAPRPSGPRPRPRFRATSLRRRAEPESALAGTRRLHALGLLALL